MDAVVARAVTLPCGLVGIGLRFSMDCPPIGMLPDGTLNVVSDQQR